MPLGRSSAATSSRPNKRAASSLRLSTFPNPSDPRRMKRDSGYRMIIRGGSSSLGV
jgi:hypothetical protein